MNRVLKRPMFRIGGSAGTGITSGLDTPKRGLVDGPGKYSQDPEDRTFKTDVGAAIDAAQVANDPRVQRTLFSTPGGFGPGSAGGFLTSFGLDLLARPPQGGTLATIAAAAKGPFETFQAANLAKEDDRTKFARDLFIDELQGQRDIAEAREKGGTKTFEKDRAAGAVTKIFDSKISNLNAKIDQLDKNDPNYKDKLDGFKSQKDILENTKIDNIKSIYLSQATQDEFQRQVILKLLQNADIEEVAGYFPNFETIMGPGFELPRDGEKEGGRIGYRDGTKMMESIVEQEKEQGEVQDLSYTQLRSRLPNEISNEIVMLLSNSKQALLDFANIQTTQDIQSFNQQYDVNLTLPQGA